MSAKIASNIQVLVSGIRVGGTVEKILWKENYESFSGTPWRYDALVIRNEDNEKLVYIALDELVICSGPAWEKYVNERAWRDKEKAKEVAQECNRQQMQKDLVAQIKRVVDKWRDNHKDDKVTVTIKLEQ